MPVTTLRRDGACASCAAPLRSGSRAFYDPGTGQVTCAHHHPDQPAPAASPARGGGGDVEESPLVWWSPPEPAGTDAPQNDEGPKTGRLWWGRARSSDTARGGGASAREFADHTAAEYRASVRSRWGVVAPLVLLARPDDASVRAARKGAAGEEKLAAFLDRVARRSNGRVVALHDRTIPGRRENIDHLVCTSSGVWAVDSKAYAGLLSTGGRWSRSRSLTMGGRDGERLVRQSVRQQRCLVENYTCAGLPVLPTHGALCFLDGSWGPGADGSQVENVWVVSPRRLRRLLLADGPLSVDEVAYAAAALGAVFTPARWDT